MPVDRADNARVCDEIAELLGFRSRVKRTGRNLKAMDNPNRNVFAHPTGRIIAPARGRSGSGAIK